MGDTAVVKDFSVQQVRSCCDPMKTVRSKGRSGRDSGTKRTMSHPVASAVTGKIDLCGNSLAKGVVLLSNPGIDERDPNSPTGESPLEPARISLFLASEDQLVSVPWGCIRC